MLSDPTKREIYDSYGSVGLALADQIGADNLKTYFMMHSCWFKVSFANAPLGQTNCQCFVNVLWILRYEHALAHAGFLQNYSVSQTLVLCGDICILIPRHRMNE